METTALNFSLLSEREQQAVIAAFSAFINSLSFPTQILIRSQKKDITTYLKFLEETTKNIENPKLAHLRDSYKTFLQETVKKKNVLGKRFFIIIPFSPLELGITSRSFFSLLQQKNAVPYSKNYVIKKAKIALYPKRDHLIRQAGRLGLKLTQLNTQQITELFNEVYNPPASTLTRPEIFRSQEAESGKPQTKHPTQEVLQNNPPWTPRQASSNRSKINKPIPSA